MGSHNVRTHWMHHLYIKNWPEDGSLEPKHFANYVLIDYIFVVCDWINYYIVLYNTAGWFLSKL